MPWSNQGGGPWGSGPKGPWGSGPQSQGPAPPDLEDWLRRGQDKLRTVMPGGGGSIGPAGYLIVVLVALVALAFACFFRVQPDEVGVVMRFGQYVRQVQPGLNPKLPWPIEDVITQTLRVRPLNIGIRVIDEARRGGTPTMRDVPEESLMLTGDENIVDVDFTVFWRVKPDGVGDYSFNIQNPEGTVKSVAESAMREVVGRSTIQPLLTGARQNTENAVHDLMQKTLDYYGSGIQIQQVQMQKVDNPGQVIDSARDVQAARLDADRARNEAETYANRVVPEAKGKASQILQSAEAYRAQTVQEATGQTARFLQILDQYQKAPDVTRQRMYLETMERVFNGTDKVILDAGQNSGVVPYLPLPSLGQPRPAPQQQQQQGGSR